MQDLLSMGKQLGANVDGLGVNNITITNRDALERDGFLHVKTAEINGGSTEIKRLQKALCVNPDGIFGEKSVRALRDYQVATCRTVDGKLTDPLKQELLGLPDTEIEARCKKKLTTMVAEQAKSLASSLQDVSFKSNAGSDYHNHSRAGRGRCGQS